LNKTKEDYKMRVTIKGMTLSTIAFNTLGIVLRGDSRNTQLYPESIARHIDIVNEDQLTEVNSLVNAGFIVVEPETTSEENKKVSKGKEVQVAKTTESSSEDEEIEDAPKPKSRGRGRPKGSKNKATKKSEAKKIKKVEKALESEKVDKKSENTEPESKPVIMTPNGPKAGRTVRTAAGEIKDGEATRASIEAMKKLEEEEELDKNLPDQKIDESNLDPSEQSGLEAVISAHGNSQKVKMENSILPESKQIKERAVEFIDKNEKEQDDADQAFLDEFDDDNLDDFLEC
jgi:hypothetical protein